MKERSIDECSTIEDIQSKVVSILHDYRDNKELFKEALEWIIEQL